LHHLKNNITDERNTIVIVSWQAPYTLGRRIADREPRVRIFGEEYPCGQRLPPSAVSPLTPGSISY
jgi:predicted metal-dependent RNase